MVDANVAYIAFSVGEPLLGDRFWDVLRYAGKYLHVSIAPNGTLLADAVQDYSGKLALSDGGTLFLDEISELPLEIQAKLLHVLEIPEFYPIGSNIKRTIDFHLITATTRNLRKMVDEGLFRHDLYYRIAVIPVKIPPLRMRKCDILPLTDYFLKKKGKEFIISPAAKLKLLEYHWQGNVRELINVIERSVLFTDTDSVKKDIV